ncbi:MAG: hypothetical protein DRO14_02805 [Thermoprotei archaeon]|nr:MAG: hypothetical protein DRO14_02805 [Thermoprotei archaeon]
MKSLQIEDLDEIDWKIITELQRDGRVSLVELGRKVGLKHPSVRARLSKLISSGLIKVQANINIKKLGYSLAVVNIEVEDVSSVVKEVSKLSRCPKVLFATIKSGDYNLMLLVTYRDVRELKAFIEKRVRRLPKLRRFSIELDVIIKPEFIPWNICHTDPHCMEECESCELRKGVISCPGCSINKLNTAVGK